MVIIILHHHQQHHHRHPQNQWIRYAEFGCAHRHSSMPSCPPHLLIGWLMNGSLVISSDTLQDAPGRTRELRGSFGLFQEVEV